MFESLKKKFSSFIDSITKKEEETVKQEEKKEGTDKTEKVASAPEPPIEPKAPVEKEHVKIPDAQPPVKIHREEQKPAIRQQEQKVTLGTRLKSAVFREVRVSHNDVEPFLEQLKISLLQSDVNYEVTEKILSKMETELTARPIEAKDLQRNISGIIRSSILSVLSKGSDIDMIGNARARKGSGDPFRILFLGPNGAGKTTAMAKLAHMFMKNGFTCVLSASDTFRAAAIEQTAYHASKLGIHAIKGNYGADPASIAFDAIAYAKAHGIDVVLIDSAGRQETNRSLMEEIKKMVRVAKPDMKIFVGESITGNALLNQVREFNEAVRLDGIILTKLDADAKGGNTLSILSETNVPVLFFGTGESYDAIMAYSPEFVLDSIIPNN